MTAIEKLIKNAVAEEGYLEKATNHWLDDKTANAGKSNYTKYARDLDSLKVYNGPKNGYDWCDVFVDWNFIQVFGLTTGLQMLCQPKGGYGAGCTSSANYFKACGRFFKKNPQVGDQIFFTNDGGKTMCHTGIVTAVKDGKVFTIEGNTSASPWMEPNGGCVRQKSYTLAYNRIGGYGRPDYSLAKEDKPMGIKEAKELVKQKAGLSDETMLYLDLYKYGDFLIIKLAEAMK